MRRDYGTFPRWIAHTTALLLFVLLAYPAQAQHTNMSNGTSTIVTTSDAVGGAFAKIHDGALRASFASDEVQQRVNDVAASLNVKLAQGTLVRTAFASADPMAHSLSAVQHTLSCVLSPRAAEASDVCRQNTETALSAAGDHAAPAHRLVESLDGLTAGDVVTADRLMAAQEAFNAFVDEAPAEYLAAPPDEFTVIHTVLSTLVEAAASTQ